MSDVVFKLSSCPFPAQGEQSCCTFAYSELSQSWVGTFSYNFDKYVVKDDSTIYGMKNGNTYTLNEGSKISGQDIVAKVLTAIAPAQIKDKEFLRIRVNSDNKPEEINFYTSFDEYESGDIKGVILKSQLKDYLGYEQYIPRRIDNGNRVQSRVLLYEIKHSDETEFTLVDVQVQYKLLN